MPKVCKVFVPTSRHAKVETRTLRRKLTFGFRNTGKDEIILFLYLWKNTKNIFVFLGYLP